MRTCTPNLCISSFYKRVLKICLFLLTYSPFNCVLKWIDVSETGINLPLLGSTDVKLFEKVDQVVPSLTVHFPEKTQRSFSHAPVITNTFGHYLCAMPNAPFLQHVK